MAFNPESHHRGEVTNPDQAVITRFIRVIWFLKIPRTSRGMTNRMLLHGEVLAAGEPRTTLKDPSP
jgi:hypothetical protein